eukprot:jgi/Bigna1/88337/estExt_fgenesh1_pg.C_300187
MSSSQPFIILVAAAVIANSSHIATNSHAGKTSALLDAMESLESPCDFDCCQCARESCEFNTQNTEDREKLMILNLVEKELDANPAMAGCKTMSFQSIKSTVFRKDLAKYSFIYGLHIELLTRFEPMAGLGPREWNPLTANWVFADPLLHKVKSHMMNDSYAVAPQRSIAYQAVRNIIQNEREDEGLSSFNNLNSPMKRHVSN